MSSHFHLKIVTPTEVFFDADVESLTAPGEEGYFGVLVNHAPFITRILPGRMTLRKTDGAPPAKFNISSGFFEISKNKAVLLAEKIEIGKV